MPTEKPRIQVYLEPELYQKLIEWKEEREISKISEALNQVVAEYFGVSSQSPIPNSQPSITTEKINEIIGDSLKNFGQMLDLRLDTFQAQIDSLKQEEQLELGAIQWLKLQVSDVADALSKIKGDLGGLNDRLDAVEDSLEVVLSESPSESLAQSGDTRSPEQIPQAEAPGLEEADSSNADLEGDTDELIEGTLKPDELPSNSPRLSKADLVALLNPLTQTELAKRLLCHKSMISRHKESGNFEGWSKERDPDAIAWRYDRKRQKFCPVS